MTYEPYLDQLTALADPDRAEGMAQYHKVNRRYLGLANPQINDLTKALAPGIVRCWSRHGGGRALANGHLRSPPCRCQAVDPGSHPPRRRGLDPDRRLVAGFRQLGHRRPRLHGRTETSGGPSRPVWTRSKAGPVLITCGPAAPRWWPRCPWCKQRHPKPDELKARQRILGWAASYVPDRDWFIQKAIAWWLRDLSKRDPEIVRDFLERYGAQMKPFARKEAARYLTD